MVATLAQQNIPFVNLVGQHRALKQELLDAVAGVLDHGMFILGPEVEQFEQRFAALCGTRYAVGVNSGTDALLLALRALDIGPGDEVITAPNSFVATASAIALAGATPVFADVGEDMNLDPARVEAAITPRTRALLPVHLTGRAADMTAIMEIAARHKLHVVEDAAQAVFAAHHGRRVGSLGTLGCFSLHPLKTLNACGDGGVITTDDADLNQRLRILRNLGLRTREQCQQWSGNSRLDSVQAAMLRVKIEHLPAWTEARRRNAARYQRGLGGIAELTLPVDPPHDYAVYHTFVVRAERRDELKAFLAERGVGTGIHYPIPIHLQEAAQSLDLGPGSFPVAEFQAQRLLSLPIYPELTHEQIDYVIAAIREFYRQ